MAELSVLEQDGAMRLRTGLVAVALVAGLVALAPVAQAQKTVTIKGRGWGHGIGMSQYGAYGRALDGQSSSSILEHYYKGAGVRAADMPGKIRVGLLQGRSSITTTSEPKKSGGDGKVVFKVQGSGRVIAQGDRSDTFKAEASAGGARLYRNGNRIKKDGKSVFGDRNHPLVQRFAQFGSRLKVGGKPSYSYGKADFVPYACGGSTCLHLVLSLSMQRYLYGLGEVPSSWPQASLQAQAIAGRTYALAKIRSSGQHRITCDCAVFDSTFDQAYIGDAKRTGSGSYWDDWRRAVDVTKAQIVLYQGSPIQALYSSSSGGYTENNENVWGGSPVQYLRGVSDKLDRAEGANPNFRWKVTMPFSTFSDKLDNAYGTGKLDKFKLVEPFGVSGRVTVVKPSGGGVKIVGSKKTVRADGWEIRSALGLKDTWFRVDIVVATAGSLAATYEAAGGTEGPLGEAQSARRGADTLPGGGSRQRFEGGTIYSDERGASFALWGELDRVYRDLGEASSECGYPTSSQVSRTRMGDEATFEFGSIKITNDGVVTVECSGQ